MEAVIRIWHAFRIPILTILLTCSAAIQLYLYLRYRRQKSAPISASPPAFDSKPDHISNETLVERVPLVAVPRGARTTPKRIIGDRSKKVVPHATTDYCYSVQPIVFFSSLSGTTENAADGFASSLWGSLCVSAEQYSNRLLKPNLLDLSYIEYDDYFTSLPKADGCRYFYIILLPTYNIDTNLDNFLEHLRETHHDFRVDTAPLSGLLGYSVFGFGDKEDWPTEDDGFCSQAIETDKWMARLTNRKRAYPLGMGNVKGDAMQRLGEWREGVENILRDFAAGKTLGEGVLGSGDALESDEEDTVEEGEEAEGADADVTPKAAIKGRSSIQRPNRSKSKTIDDLESLGANFSKARDKPKDNLPIDFTVSGKGAVSNSPQAKEMVPKASPTYNALTKQGYTIVGSHSGVKICRWTKSALRGRGSCYKFSFYGIKSHLCMETTPSLSCSNKCVFCWRHGTNPVGTTWRWQVDPPDMIFEGVKKGHYAKIKMMRGVPGVRAERFEEAMRIKHCALSLVGEPIFYPHINEFTALLHNERISSFLVCNAQHPDQLATLKPVTQLYVSIDASNRESLRKIDRPLHRDFWERFCRCLDILREKRYRQRTVFRLTLVKGFNIEDEAEGYADLVARGLPCFVEIKGVTYCGTSTSAGAGLTMKNVPFYEEVCDFVQALNAALERRGLDYGIAAEHAHSCCVLLASKRFLKQGKWHTVIDYGKFFELLESGVEFSPEDYTAETAEWALWGNGGFDPADERVRRKGKKSLEAE